jgi:aminoglycoside phosphotransferase (APT) family kinase protein
MSSGQFTGTSAVQERHRFDALALGAWLRAHVAGYAGPLQVAQFKGGMNAVIVALHQVESQQTGLADFGKPGNYFARQIGRWTAQYRASEAEPLTAMDALIDWLPLHIPAGDAVALVHGDDRLDNLVFHATAPRVVAEAGWQCVTASTGQTPN